MTHMKIINQISYAALTVLVLLLSACQKDIVDHPDGDDFSSDGAPKIEKITPTSSKPPSHRERWDSGLPSRATTWHR